jgi:hypothetical protein
MYVQLQMYSMFQLTVNRNENFLKWPSTISSRIFFSCLMKSTREHHAYCKYCKQDLSIQHGGRDEHTHIQQNSSKVPSQQHIRHAIGMMFPCRFHKAREEYSGRNRCPNFLFFPAEASLVPSEIAKLTKTCCVH